MALDRVSLTETDARTVQGAEKSDFTYVQTDHTLHCLQFKSVVAKVKKRVNRFSFN